MTSLGGLNFFWCHPHGANDALIKRPVCVMRTQYAGKGKAQVGDVPLWTRPLVNADKRGGCKAPGGLFQRFARASGNERLAFIEMACRLV